MEIKIRLAQVWQLLRLGQNLLRALYNEHDGALIASAVYALHLMTGPVLALAERRAVRRAAAQRTLGERLSIAIRTLEQAKNTFILIGVKSTCSTPISL